MIYSKLFKLPLFKNTFWGIISNVFQNLFYSVFFIILARKYSSNEFGSYVIANMVYSFILGFSTLGLGNWFAREMMTTNDESGLAKRFLKIQIIIGVVFYIINIFFVFVLYKSHSIRMLSVIIGCNILFDNIIYVIKYYCISHENQIKSFGIITMEAFLKFFVGLLIFFMPIPLEYLFMILLLIRFVTINYFINIATNRALTFSDIITVKINSTELTKFVLKNWPFVVISSIALVNWRIGNFFISKYLTLTDVSYYEVSFKLLSVTYLIPVIISTSVFPLFIKKIKVSFEEAIDTYNTLFLFFLMYGIFVYTFFYTYSDIIIPILFGESYIPMIQFCKQQFSVMIFFPTVLLQANFLVAMKLEKIDMFCNIFSLFVNVVICLIGLHYFKSVSVVNISVTCSFVTFHLIQDVVLLKKRITTFNHLANFYIFVVAFYYGYNYLSILLNKSILFWSLWLFVFVLLIFYFKKFKSELSIIISE